MVVVIGDKTCWQILEIEPTEDKRKIKKAYAGLLKKYHPEEYPEEFKQIEAAYKEALQSTQGNNKAVFNGSIKEKNMLHDENANKINDGSIFDEKEIPKRDYSIHLDEAVVEDDVHVSRKGMGIHIEDQEMEVKQREVHIPKRNTQQNSSEGEQSYLLKKINFLLANDTSIRAIDNIFNDGAITRELNDTVFKKQVEAILLMYIDSMDIEAIAQLTNQATIYMLEEVHERLRQRTKRTAKPVKKRSNKTPIILMVIVFLLAVTMGALRNSLKSSYNNVNSEDERQKAIRESMEQSNKETMLEGSVTICEVNSSYMNRITIEVVDGVVALKDENGNVLIKDPIDSFACNLGSPLIPLWINGQYQIFDTATRAFYPGSYDGYGFVDVEEDGVMRTGGGIIVLEDDGWYLLDTSGNATIRVGDGTTLPDTIVIENGEVVGEE